MSNLWLAFLVMGVVVCGGCGDTSSGGAVDGVGRLADLAIGGDLAVGGADLGGVDAAAGVGDASVAGDGSAAVDSSMGVDAGTVVCGLGNDPLPCTKDADCAASGAKCDLGKRYCVCVMPNCTPGVDQTCNDNPAIGSLHGHCTPFGSCMCLGFMKDPATGKCF
jgi:hypothetical protein